MKTLDDIRPGATIGRYEFLVPIAKGGMAAVWAARLKGTRGFAKTVAIKTMLPTLSDDPLFEQMFLDEAQLAAQIHHPNVVEIMDLGEQEDILYQVMEYVDGESLATVLRTISKKKDRLPLEIAVRIVMDACRGLHAAHELKNVDGTLLGLVHRDISPQNIMITYDGVVKLVDFGVAKAAGRTTSETTAGQIKGKAPYMAPEQALGQRVDRRTDVFAMGIVLYQITTGKHPFRGENDIATLHNILHNELPSPRFVDAQFPRPLEAAINRALSRDVTKRFASAKDMADALSRVFPPTRRRADVADVGAFVQELLGETGNRRRSALAEAIKRADSRTGAAPPGDSSGSMLLPLAEIGTDSAVHSPRGLAAPTERIDVTELGVGRPSYPGLPPSNDLAGRLSAPATLDLEDPIREAQTVRPGPSGTAALPVPAPPPMRDRLPSFDDEKGRALVADALAPTSDGTPGTATAAMVSLAEPAPPKSKPRWPVAAFITGAVIVGVGMGLSAWTLLRGQDTPDVSPTTPTASALDPTASAEPPQPDAALVPAYSIDAVSAPVPEDAAASASAPAPTAPVPTVWVPKPPGTGAPPTTATATATATPTATATSTSTWKPPPVSDPGF
jgi:serine/threonine-protein kinase